MTLYLLFERLEAGKMRLDTEMQVPPTPPNRRRPSSACKPGQTLKVEDAIKALVTKSANDASVVIAEAIAGNEDDFAKLMTRKARALGMSKTTYGTPPACPTTSRSPRRAIRPCSAARSRSASRDTTAISPPRFAYRGQAIRNHNRLLGHVEGVDGIKTGYTRASGFNLVTSMRRGNRHWSPSCWAAAAAVRATPSCATCWPRTGQGRHQAYRRRDHRAQPRRQLPRSPKPRPQRSGRNGPVPCRLPPRRARPRGDV